ncbi:MAG: hypothetical protein JWM77_1188 [Rhodospirillales bacterium]|nr:hypothetical protein [Rhodospirillales bacterium]
MNSTTQIATRRLWPDYRSVWRWHFYAGLFCIPFILWLATTGSIYLFKPQIQAWLDRPYDELQLAAPRAAPAQEVAAALAAVPGTKLRSYQLPKTPDAAAQILVGQGAELTRVYVHPVTLQPLRIVREEDQLMRVLFRLHGELKLGDGGSYAVELAASWTIVMIATGLALWWPRDRRGRGGVVYPRLAAGGRTFWRDLHAVTGLWVSFFALFLLLSGLPWAKSWGGYLKEIRRVAGTEVVQQDWSTGSSSEQAALRALDQPVTDEHAQHGMHPGMHGATAPFDPALLDRVVAHAIAARVAPPVLVSPPDARSPTWTAQSDAGDRTQRATLTFDNASGAVATREAFAQRPLIDRAVGVGVAAHEGQLFGWANQALSLFTASGLFAMSVGAIVMWWRRRPGRTLGAPIVPADTRAPLGLLVPIILLGLLLPLFGASLVIVLIVERVALRRVEPVRRWLGLGRIRI